MKSLNLLFQNKDKKLNQIPFFVSTVIGRLPTVYRIYSRKYLSECAYLFKFCDSKFI
jgi:hypothetical protein